MKNYPGMRYLILSIFIIALAIGIAIYLLVNSKDLSEPEVADFKVPKALFLTTGLPDGNGRLSEGVVAAIQYFNSMGIYTELENRDVIWNKEFLDEFSILILSTALHYHDADRPYSLSFMSDEELEIIASWVREGGILIAGDNVGRNLPDGTDRISLYGRLSAPEWKLAEVFGLSLSEVNLIHYELRAGNPGSQEETWLKKLPENKWSLVVDSLYDDSVKILAYWTNDTTQYPAMTEHYFGSGKAILLPTSYLLHPANAGGIWGTEMIRQFYDHIASLVFENNEKKILLNPWPDAFDAAFCLSLNAGGTKEEYERIGSWCEAENINETYFVNGNIDPDIISLLRKEKHNLQSSSYSYSNFQNLNYQQSLQQIKQNEYFWEYNFRGFRFPYTRTSFTGLYCLNKNHYLFDSSIGADNIGALSGSVVPYRIPIANNSFYEVLDMIEIAPPAHDDYFYLEGLEMTDDYNPLQISKAVDLFGEYLLNFWEYGVKPYKGVLVYLGHPLYTAHNDTSMLALMNLVEKLRKENVWFTELSELAGFRMKLSKLSLSFGIDGERVILKPHLRDNNRINGLTVYMEVRPVSVEAKAGKAKIIEREGIYYVVFDAFNGQEIGILFNED